jgi:hypothetical protein
VVDRDPRLDLDAKTSDGSPDVDDADQATEGPNRVERLPKEVGVLLMTAGLITGMLPPPPGPFDLMIVLSGGLAVWPRGFRAVESWARKHWPGTHRVGLHSLNRYLQDLECRYPGSTEDRGRPGD